MHLGTIAIKNLILSDYYIEEGKNKTTLDDYLLFGETSLGYKLLLQKSNDEE